MLSRLERIISPSGRKKGGDDSKHRIIFKKASEVRLRIVYRVRGLLVTPLHMSTRVFSGQLNEGKNIQSYKPHGTVEPRDGLAEDYVESRRDFVLRLCRL